MKRALSSCETFYLCSFFFVCLPFLFVQNMMQTVAQLNPFSTEHFIWIDSGYFRRRQARPKSSPIVRNNITRNGVDASKVYFRNFLDNPKFQDLSAGAFGGTRKALDEFADKYWRVFWHMSQKNYFVGTEQTVMTTTCLNFPSCCFVHQPRGGGDWFRIGVSWLRDYEFSFARDEVLLKDNPIAKNSTQINPIIQELLPLPEKVDPISKVFA